MKHYKFDKDRGIIDEADHQVLQLVSGNNKFRRLCGTLLVERLNEEAAQSEQVDNVQAGCGIVFENDGNALNVKRILRTPRI